MTRPPAILNMWKERRHFIPLGDEGDGRNCAGPGVCPHCDAEMKEVYVSDETKKKIRAILEEHLGPTASAIGDQDDLRERGKNLEWVTVTIALEDEFSVTLSESVLYAAHTIDGIARIVDLHLDTKNASPH